jgi:hypothetical protein
MYLTARKIFLCIAFVLAISSGLFAQIKINEFLASNASINTDPDYNQNADWIELYNAGNAPVNLNGYYITDNYNTPDKWQITQNVSIPAKGFILIWTDGNAAGLHTNFKISALGEEIALYTPNFVLVDSLSFGAQNVNISFGRSPDGSKTWRYFQEPTPGAANITAAYMGLVDNVPEFLQRGGLYNSAVSVEMFTDLGGTIRYTLDGSEPTNSSTIYSAAIPVSATTIIRARIFKPNQIPGRIVTQSYFINEGFESRKLPVVSIATNPENFWDPVKGIYVQDFKPDWEIPVNIELFENNGNDRASFNEQAGIKVNGLYSWQLPQKMLGVYFKKQYGAGSLSYHMFFDRDRTNFKDFALRASGSDWSYTMFRDGLIQQACHNYNMHLDNMGFRPSVVYVNGQYMGIHNMREKVDEDYIASNYNLENGTFDIIENGDFAESGNLDAYNAFWALVNKDLSVQKNYDTVAALMDIENFTDLIVTELYDGNTSIDHNVMAWKPKEDGKWKWILMDLDRGFFDYGSNLISFYSGQTAWPLRQLLANTAYKQYFGKRLANHLYTTYNPIRINKRIDYHQKLIEAEIPNHVDRWLGTTSPYGDAMPSVQYWYDEVAKLKTYADGRPLAVINDLENYGFSAPAQLSLSVSPSGSGEFLFNEMKVPEPDWNGYYPKNLDISLTAVDKPGYNFVGWKQTISTTLIPKGSTWKYLDNGSNQNTAWYASAFNDASWNSGAAELGYGDGDEQTTVSYGSNSNNKYITTYFRKLFTLSAGTKSNGSFILNLLRDDGAVVYLNGQEIIRSNMPTGNVAYNTLASSSISGTAESTFISYTLDASYFLTGTNVIAVEIHQNATNSTDISFDLELLADVPDASGYVSTSSNYHLSLTGNKKLIAVFQANGQCIIPDTIAENTTLHKDCSPYVVQGDVSIPENITLTIEPGVEIYMAPGSNFTINGNILANGTADENILFRLNPDYSNESWGALCFISTSDTTKMNYVTIEDASDGPIPVWEVAAISAFKSDLVLDHLNIVKTNSNPITARYSSVVLTNSNLHSEVTGDLINVKYGKARIENSTFVGNNSIDADGIDYDGITDGIIANCSISNCNASNSDAVDIGEEAKNIRISNIFVNVANDKGISVGQRSSVIAENCTFVNTTLGAGVKDSSWIQMNHCTFYNVGTPVACYEKIVGRAGGNAIIKNSILSNSGNATYLCDSRSTIVFSNCLSDNDTLPANSNNIFGNPLFEGPNSFDFSLESSSPALNTGYDNGNISDLGPIMRNFIGEPLIEISDIFYNLNNNPDRSEFIALHNPGSSPVDISGYTLSDAIEFTFPEGSNIAANGRVFVAKSFDSPPKWYYWPIAWQWTTGSLSNQGETIRLTNNYGVIIDRVYYKPDAPWPDVTGNDEKVISIISSEYDNHFGENWKTTNYSDLVNSMKETINEGFTVYPNPVHSSITVQLTGATSQNIEIYTVTGVLVYSNLINDQLIIDLSQFSNQLLFFRIGEHVEKVIVLGGR